MVDNGCGSRSAGAFRESKGWDTRTAKGAVEWGMSETTGSQGTDCRLEMEQNITAALTWLCAFRLLLQGRASHTPRTSVHIDTACAIQTILSRTALGEIGFSRFDGGLLLPPLSKVELSTSGTRSLVVSIRTLRCVCRHRRWPVLGF